MTVENLTMAFSKNVVLDHVNFSLHQGEVLALLGENGAGKSTLMKILNGIYAQKEGSFFLGGNTEPCSFQSTREAQEQGIILIHQELNLVPNRTVAENMVLGKEPLQAGLGRVFSLVDRNDMRSKARKHLDMIHAEHIDVDCPVYQLTSAQQQLVEIAKALISKPKILLMDEPTSSLSEDQTKNLIEVIHRLKSQIGIIFTTHRIQEALEVADRFLILRDGKQAADLHAESENITYEQVIELMVGRSIENTYPKIEVTLGEPVLQIEQLADESRSIEHIDIRKGEIFGFGGLVGAGRSEVLRLLFGVDKAQTYKVKFNGNPLRIHSPAEAIRCGIGFVPEDRKLQSISAEQTVIENMVLSYLTTAKKKPFISGKRLLPKVMSFIKSMDIKAFSPYQQIKYLSGGNQQKVVLSKWLMVEPSLLILDEPTRGIDVGAKVEIYKLMGELVKQGVSIILISSDLPELVSMSDRVAVMSEGKLMKVLNREELTSEHVMYYAGLHLQETVCDGASSYEQ